MPLTLSSFHEAYKQIDELEKQLRNELKPPYSEYNLSPSYEYLSSSEISDVISNLTQYRNDVDAFNEQKDAAERHNTKIESQITELIHTASGLSGLGLTLAQEAKILDYIHLTNEELNNRSLYHCLAYFVPLLRDLL